MEKNIEKNCAVCGHKYMADIYDQGECPHCGWCNDYMVEQNKNKVIYPNLISLNKAKRLFKEGKPFEPNLDDFAEALFFYSEVQFKYQGLYYEVIITDYEGEEVVRMNDFNGGHWQVFKTKEEFKNKANIDGKLLKDIWDETTERDWLQ